MSLPINLKNFLCVQELTPSCGDGIVQTGEFCDDGNLDDGDGCTTQCEPPYCGDGLVTGDEQCDDGFEDNTGDWDGCNSDCTVAGYCGDGVVNGPEACDDGTENNTGAYGGCNNDCTLAGYCGDGVTNGPEECDDENEIDTDDCTSSLPGCGLWGRVRSEWRNLRR